MTFRTRPPDFRLLMEKLEEGLREYEQDIAVANAWYQDWKKRQAMKRTVGEYVEQ